MLPEHHERDVTHQADLEPLHACVTERPDESCFLSIDEEFGELDELAGAFSAVERGGGIQSKCRFLIHLRFTIRVIITANVKSLAVRKRAASHRDAIENAFRAGAFLELLSLVVREVQAVLHSGNPNI